MAAEGARLRGVVQRQGDLAEAVAARLESVQGERAATEAELASFQGQFVATRADAEALSRELECLMQFVLPSSPLLDESHASSAMLGDAPVLEAVRRARRIAGRLRLAVEAKFETFGLAQHQLRGRLEVSCAAAGGGGASGGGGGGAWTPPGGHTGADCIRSGSCTARKASTSSAGLGQSMASLTAAPPAAVLESGVDVTVTLGELAELRTEVANARGEVEEERSRGAAAADKLTEEAAERWQAARELEAVRRALRVRDAEVRELQLLGKYFSGRERAAAPPALDAAELAEELRGRCMRLSDETARLRVERDLLRAERERRC
eukprot:NODE_10067_length_1379_cov_3.003195.p1 GENE.NODE_10067_length_1379_cov_3.003195~~NODE_10067_length_1379_cov_3.003195.p1  ORF type:complete len:364 (+),score=152.51 NODE_10067_length_1379_cov_3.003195:129-1094(+)